MARLRGRAWRLTCPPRAHPPGATLTGLWQRIQHQDATIAAHDADCQWKRRYDNLSRKYAEQSVKNEALQLRAQRAESRAGKAERDLRRLERYLPPRRRWLNRRPW